MDGKDPKRIRRHRQRRHPLGPTARRFGVNWGGRLVEGRVLCCGGHPLQHRRGEGCGRGQRRRLLLPWQEPAQELAAAR